MKMKIEEVIVVEGRDDVINLKRFVEAEIIATHGYGITEETIDKIRTANRRKGIIILTDPDFAGEKIRKRLGSLFHRPSMHSSPGKTRRRVMTSELKMLPVK